MNLVAAILLVSAAILGVSNYRHRSTESVDVIIEHAHRRLVSEGERPTIYTYYEQSEVYKPDDDTMDLIENWRKSWYDMGWNPVILTPQNAQQLPEYDALMKMIPDDSMLGRDSMPHYRRWMAMAAAGGGWMCEYTVWPLNYFLQHGRVLPFDGAITTYMGSSPVLVSGSGDEFRRMVYQIGQTAGKIIDRQKWLNENSPELFKKVVNWNDAVALQELRKSVSKDMFKVRSDVVDRSRLADDDGAFDCNVSNGKRAVFFRGLTGNAYENRGTQARKFLNQWRAACGLAQAAELQASG